MTAFVDLVTMPGSGEPMVRIRQGALGDRPAGGGPAVLLTGPEWDGLLSCPARHTYENLLAGHGPAPEPAPGKQNPETASEQVPDAAGEQVPEVAHD